MKYKNKISAHDKAIIDEIKALKSALINKGVLTQNDVEKEKGKK